MCDFTCMTPLIEQMQRAEDALAETLATPAALDAEPPAATPASAAGTYLESCA